jgi:hypothetical protein
MKTILALAVLLNVTAVSAQNHIPPYYSAEYKITKVSPMCPSTIPAGAQCMGFGSIVQIEAIIGCTDKVEHKRIDVWGNNEIHTDVLVKRDPNSANIRCYRAQILEETVLVHSPGKVTIVNDGIQF